MESCPKPKEISVYLISLHTEHWVSSPSAPGASHTSQSVPSAMFGSRGQPLLTFPLAGGRTLWGISHKTTWGVCWVCSWRQHVSAGGSKLLGSKPEMTILMNDAGQMKKNRWSHERSYWSLLDPSGTIFCLSHLHSLNGFKVIKTNLQKIFQLSFTCHITWHITLSLLHASTFT